MKKLFLFTVFITTAIVLTAQTTEDPGNVVISKSKKEFWFVKGNAEHPVQIREESSKLYTCNSYRTDIPVVEFYNDVETVDDVNIYVNESKKHGVFPKYEYYNSNGTFYSDAHVCYFQLPLLKKGSTSEVVFKKTILEPNYFNSIYFMDDQLIEDQEIKLVVPSWMQLDIKEFNFGKYNVQKNVTPGADQTVYTYTMKNIPAMKSERSAPGPSYFAPHILVLCKSAQPKDEKYVYFNTLKEQYDWYKKAGDGCW